MPSSTYILGGYQTDFAKAWSRNGQDIVRRHARAMESWIELDQHAEALGASRHGAPERLGRVRRFDAHHHGDALVERAQPPRPVGTSGPRGIGLEQVREAGVGQYLGFAKRGDSQPGHTRVHLTRDDLDAFRRLRVRTQAHAA